MSRGKDETSLEFLYPDIAMEWHPYKNGQLKPSAVSSKSGTSVWWICKEGHEWTARVADRTNKHGCPYCSGRKAIPGQSDISTLFPELMKEWDYEKNEGIDPLTIKPGSKKKVYWKCFRGHSWQAIAKHRTNGSGCPYCAGNLPIVGETDLLTTHPQLCAEWNHQRNVEIKPETVSKYSNKIVWWQGACGHEWQDSITHRSAGRGCPECNARNKTSFPEQAIFYYVKKQYPSAFNRYTDFFENGMEIDIYIPEIKTGIEYDGVAWHSGKMAIQREKSKYDICHAQGITLIRIKECCNQSVEDLCDICFETKDDLDLTIKQLSAVIYLQTDINTDRDRTRILENYYTDLKKNSLQEKFPEISKEWHPLKNGKLTPSMFSSKSSEKVWWICKKGHEWETPISERTHAGNGCPYCSNHRLLTGFNDLATVHPQLAQEWHPIKNESLKPTNVFGNSRTIVWWQCKKGHEWKTSIKERARNKGCPFCSNKRVLLGYNDLATTKPLIAAEWNTERNSPLQPTDVTFGSRKKVWWKCADCGHEWQTQVASRKGGSGCPKCAYMKRVCPK